MTKAYVLLVTKPAMMRSVAAALREIAGVLEVHEVMGPFDIVAEVECESVEALRSMLFETIRGLPGVTTTTTLVAFAPGS